MWTRMLALVLGVLGPAGEGRAPAQPAPPAATTAPLPLPQVIDRMQKTYDATKDFRARFTQKQTSAATGRERVKTGEVLIKKPGRMRWNYDSPKEMYLSNGQTFWLYDEEAKQATRLNARSSQLAEAVSFLMGTGKLSDDFEITSAAATLPYGGPKDYKLSLKPKQPQSTYKAIYFVVDPTTFFVRESVLVKANGEVNDITFSEIKTNTKLPDSTFAWKPPAGVRIVDGDKLGK